MKQQLKRINFLSTNLCILFVVDIEGVPSTKYLAEQGMYDSDEEEQAESELESSDCKDDDEQANNSESAW